MKKIIFLTAIMVIILSTGVNAIILCNCNACDTRNCACPGSCPNDNSGCPTGHCCGTGGYSCGTYYAISKANNCGFSTTTVSGCGSGLTSSYCGIGAVYPDASCSSGSPFGCISADRTHSCSDNTICGKCAGGADTCGTAACGDTYGCSGTNVCNGQGTGAGNCVAPAGAGSTCYCNSMCTTGLVCAGNKCVKTPTWSNNASNVTNNTAINVGTIILISAQWIQVGGSPSFYVNSSRVNTSGSWTNDSTWTSFASGNWTNFTINYTIAGGNLSMKIYGNGTGNLQNVTSVYFWWNISAPSDTCTYSGSGDWYIDMKDNCTLSTANTLTGNMYIYSTGYGITTFSNIQKAHAYYLNASTGTFFYNNYGWVY